MIRVAKDNTFNCRSFRFLNCRGCHFNDPSNCFKPSSKLKRSFWVSFVFGFTLPNFFETDRTVFPIEFELTVLLYSKSSKSASS